MKNLRKKNVIVIRACDMMKDMWHMWRDMERTNDDKT